MLVPESWRSGGVEQMWQAEEMDGMVGRRVTLSDLVKPDSKYTEDNDRFFTVTEDIYREVGQLGKALRYWIKIGDTGLNLCFKM